MQPYTACLGASLRRWAPTTRYTNRYNDGYNENFILFLIFEKWRCGNEMFEAHKNLLLKFIRQYQLTYCIECSIF